jgi:hypothetical protein
MMLHDRWMDGCEEGTTPGGVLQVNAVASVMAVDVPVCHYQADGRCCTDLNCFCLFFTSYQHHGWGKEKKTSFGGIKLCFVHDKFESGSIAVILWLMMHSSL